MAFELWPPHTPPLALRRIDNILGSSSPSRPKSATKREVGNEAAARPLSTAEERFKRLQEATQARNKAILAALENQRPKKTPRKSETCPRNYHDLTEGLFGCKHYATNVSVAAPCCDEFYPCRFCHDEQHRDHSIDRKTIRKLACLRCLNVQDFTGDRERDVRCSKCHEDFARYFCDECRFYDDTAEKDIFHCNDCGVCRVGKATEFFHCKGCNACLSISLKNNHKCVERTLEGSCPVCASELKDSVQAVSVFACGHAMHEECFKEYRKRNYRCPTCSKSLGDVREYFAEIDRIMKQSQMPPQYAHVLARITCADCEKRSTVPFHFMYHKCSHCGSYNTNVLEQRRL